MDTLKCCKCGHEWIPRVPDPVQCPRCRSVFWNDDSKARDAEEIKRQAKDAAAEDMHYARRHKEV